MWRIEFDRRAFRDLEKLGKVNRDRVREFLDERLLPADNPRLLGKPLKGTRTDLWRYRVGDIRIVAEIVDTRFVVLVVAVANRREAYR
jgi:mRNA interferase RelE/StbE